MVLTRQNRREIGAMIELAASLGSGGVRFGHLMPNSPGAEELELSLAERRAVEQEIWDRRSRAAVPIGMAPGYHAESPFFPCGPLELEEFNVDYRGNVTLCCHLSGYGDHLRGRDRAGNLADTTLRECLERLAIAGPRISGDETATGSSAENWSRATIRRACTASGISKGPRRCR